MSPAQGIDYRPMSETFTCCICEHSQTALPRDGLPTVRSNVRGFREERFPLWRCPHCRSIHAVGEVDLNRYYAQYPFLGKQLDTVTRWGYRRLLRRLRREGLTRSDRILDYGCGSGLLVQYLCEEGYDAVGYDPYSEQHGDQAVLAERYDCVIGQDVLEHAEDPLDMLASLEACCKPGGLIMLGTPNASGIDLRQGERHVHALHQPYHRHIFAVEELLRQGERRGWRFRRQYNDPYTNMPVLSLPFLHYYMRCFDGTLEVLYERPTRSLRLWLSPETLFWLAAGYFLCDQADIVVLFRTSMGGADGRSDSH